MPIEFRCTKCSKLLRTADDTAGRQAQCPECGSLSIVPGPSEPFETPIPPPSPAVGGSPMPGANSPFASGSNPFSSGAQGAETQDSGNPYQSPLGEYRAPIGLADPFAMNRVAGPATALLVTACIGILIGVVFMGFGVIELFAGPAFAPQPQQDFFFIEANAGFSIGRGLLELAMSILVFIGALKMKRLESYSFSMASAILALIPCTSPCCLLGIPFGIWALVVLSDGNVKMAFRN